MAMVYKEAIHSRNEITNKHMKGCSTLQANKYRELETETESPNDTVYPTVYYVVFQLLSHV